MKTAARNAFVVVAVLMLAALSPRAKASPRNLLAEGTDQYFWSADVVPSAAGEPPGVKTTIRYRSAGDQLRWQTASELHAVPVSLSTRGSELLVVLENGEWKIVSESGLRSGNSLPNDYRVLAMAGDVDDIWAVGAPPLGSATKTTAATPTTAATAPATQSARELKLFRLHRGEWKEVQPLPPMVRADQRDAISLAMLEGKLMLAVAGDDDRAIRVFTRLENGWQGGDDLATLAADGAMKLLTVRGRSALWVAEPGSPGSLYFAGAKWDGPAKLKPSEKLKSYDRRTLVGALGSMRLLASDGKGKLAEQLYALDGSTIGEASEAQTTSSATENKVARVIQFFLMTLLVLWMAMAVRQRPNVADAVRRMDSLGLASLPRRFLGGMIDVLPLFVSSFIVLRIAGKQTQPAAAIAFDSPEFAWMSAGLGVYFLHVTLFEVLFARSLGKFVTGTRVASLDGTRPPVLAILLRNLLRAVDVALLLPLLAVFSPLRQRVGDMAAGTIVVMNSTPIPQAPPEPESSAPPESSPPPPEPPTAA